MCAMTQFVVVVPVLDETSATLASHFMQHVLMKLGMCYIVVLDYGTPFKDAFIAICQVLNLSYDILAKRNYKGLSIEHFHCFLNKSVTVAEKERGDNNIFVHVSIVAGYAWNSAPIDGTDILRSIPTISRELHFLLDINLNAVSKLTKNNAHTDLEYLKLTNYPRHFFSSNLKIPIEDRRTAHAERIYNFRTVDFCTLVTSLWLKRQFEATSPRMKLLS